jgi:hypothetical protein
MTIQIKQNADDFILLNGKEYFTNLRVGEYRFYPDSNENLYDGNRFKDNRDFKILFESFFPDYEVILKKTNPNNIENHYMYDLLKIIKKNSPKDIILHDKTYICIKEATRDGSGLVLCLEDNKTLICKEKYITIK